MITARGANVPWVRGRLRRLSDGFTLLELLVCVAILGVLTALTACAVQAARAPAARAGCSNNLRQIGIALHAYAGSHPALPPGTVHPDSLTGTHFGPARAPYPLLNWGARVLPYLDESVLWAEVDLLYRTHPDAPNRLGVFTPRRVAAYRCPSDPLTTYPSHVAPTTNYLGVAGTSSRRSDGCLFLDSTVRLIDIPDGTSNTLLVGERPMNAVSRSGRWAGGWGPWGTGDAYLGVRETSTSHTCPEYPYPFARGTKADECSTYHFWSFHPGGANFLFADASVRFLPYAAGDALPALATRAGGES